MEWIRGFWSGQAFSCPGTFVKFLDPSDNYRKITVFMNSTLAFENNHLLIKNDDYDPDQDQEAKYEFAVADEMYFTHFACAEDG